MKRVPLRRTGKIKSKTPLKKVNKERQAKRRAGYRKMLAGKEYKSAKADAMRRAEGMCEAEADHLFTNGQGVGMGFEKGRCWSTDRLQAHHLRYPKGRPLRASDLLIVCEAHHRYLESLKMHKTRMF